MNVIRCDEPEYLVWKWRPEGQNFRDSKRENSIRFGSSLRVKDGEMAIFVYSSHGAESNQDVIVGPFDDTIKTANFPVLSNIIGLAFGGNSPFQAEIYFINLSQNIQVFFGVPYFDVFDPRFPDFPIPVAVRGSILFNITDFKQFIKNNRLINFDLKDFKAQVKSTVIKYTKSILINLPNKHNIPAVQIESQILEVNQILERYLKTRFENDFGVNLKALDIEAIEIDKEAQTYKDLKKVTKDITSDTVQAQASVNIQNLEDTQRINARNMEETLRIQRDEMQRAQKLQTETTYMAANALDKQADVMKTAAESLGQMGGSIGGSDGGFNPASMMTGMMMGGAIGGQMAGMMNQMGQNVNQQMQNGLQTPPPMPPQISYFTYINGQQAGPFDENQLRQLIQNGQLTPDSYVWKTGMPQWVLAKDTELNVLFSQSAGTPPPPPSI